MAHASGKKFGPGQQDQGKGDGTGGMAPDDVDPLPDNEILSNRDTSRHSDQRGHDGGHVQNQNWHEQVSDHAPGAGEAGRPGARSRPPLVDEPKDDEPKDDEQAEESSQAPDDTRED